MALKLENINNLIADDLASRNENWTEIDNTFELKADKSTTYTKTEVDTSLELKADKQQEAWITPTLLNGFTIYETETLRYRKTSINQLQIIGSVFSVLANDVVVFQTPLGYRPIQNYRFATLCGNNLVRAEMSSNGQLFIRFGGTNGGLIPLNITIPLD